MVEEVTQETPDVRSFRLKPAEPVAFRPGQHLVMFLDVPQDRVRDFSIASSPIDEFLLVATKFREPLSQFKQRMAQLKPGDEVEIKAAFGKFMLQDDMSVPAVLLAGGIGITPFISLIKYCTDRKLPLGITLLYSNRAPDDIAFRRELEEWARINQNFRLISTITDDASWPGQKGRIDEAMIRNYVQDLNSIFYICGPPGMVDGMTALLKGMHIPDDRVRIEKFTGY